jgi:large subunit ribosomal protein L15
MKLHDLRPAEGAHSPRTRVGRGIAGGKGKTAGRGTKGQKSRTGGTIQPWFEGGQTPIHVRLPKLRGFKNKFRVEYEIVNVGRISALAETGILDMPELEGKGAKTAKSAKAAPITVTPDILAAAGLIRSLDKPLKILGQGDVTRPIFILADAFSKSATAKIEAAGGTAQVLEFPAGDEADMAGETYKTDETAEADKTDKAAESEAPVTPTKKRAVSAEAPVTPTKKRAVSAEAPVTPTKKGVARAVSAEAPVTPTKKGVARAVSAEAPVTPTKKGVARAVSAEAPVTPTKKRVARAVSAAADTLPPTSPADETGSEV